MRNLYLTQSETVATNAEIRDAQHISLDPDANAVYVASERTLAAFDYQTKQVVNSIVIPSRDTSSQTSAAPVGLQYLYDNQAVCVATHDGQIFLWGSNSTELECVGEVEQGLVAMSWSPSLEVFIIVTTKNTMILMTSEFDPITEVSIFPDHSGEENPVSVGWGKKETQFHGSAGKEAARAQTVSLEPVGPNDPGCPFVCWRGDGCFFVISAIDPTTGARSLYIWSRECVFQAKSESLKGLQHSVFWKPSGSVIASVQHGGEGQLQNVVFFEKNGLRHGEFSIPNSSSENTVVRRLMWNPVSTILLLWINLSQQEEKEDFSEVQLWTVNNYHWYLKQCLRFKCQLSAIEWDPYNTNQLHVFTQEGDYVKYTWTSYINATSGSKPHDLASVAVIDGDHVLITPMRLAVVPPPMSAFTLSLPAPVNFVTFHPTCNDLAMITADESIMIFSYEEPNRNEDTKRKAAGGDGFVCKVDIPALKATFKLPDALHKSHFMWITDIKMLCVTYDVSGQCSVLHIMDLKGKDGIVTSRSTMPLDGLILAIALNEMCTTVAVQTDCGEVFSLDVESETVKPWETSEGHVRFPIPCPYMAVGLMGNEEVVFGLTDRHRFYANGLEISSTCTSFALHNDFLILSTIAHTIHCISRSATLVDLPRLLNSKDQPLDELTRKAERGSHIVCVVADDTKLILQMPRGNLETIHPRALVLRTFQKLMDSNQILEAFVLIRKHRINLNLMHDHNPEYFMDNVDEFINQIQSINHLNLFITELKEENVTKTMYPASYQKQSSLDFIVSNNSREKSKVDTICDALLAAFQRLGEHRYLLPILTAHVRKTKPELEQALLLVWSLHGKTVKENEPSALDALKYLLFLVDVNEMYDVALGTYNFDLVMMVAERSQKDPKEYIPFLNQMRRLEENYRKFSIDCHLKKYNSALEHISKCGEEYFEEAVRLITEHKLYLKAISLYKGKPEQLKEVANLYGAYLKTKNRNDEAGIMYIKAEDWAEALTCFRAAHDWRQVFCVAHKMSYSKNQQIELAKKIAVEMKDRQRHLEASRIYEEYAQDPEEAIAVLIEGAHWSEALRLMHLHTRLDLIETHLLDALKENAAQQMEFLKGQKEEFERHLKRLALVRLEKEKQNMNHLDGGADGHDAEADLFSDTSSITGASVSSLHTVDSSRSTVFSKATRSSRNRRKAENKRWSLKEGSPNEEFALIDALAKVIKCVDGVKEEINLLMKALIEFDFDQNAYDLQNFYSDFLSIIQSSINAIWITEDTSESNNLGPGTTANALAQAMQRGQIQQQPIVPKDPVLVFPPKFNKDVRWKLHIAGELDR